MRFWNHLWLPCGLSQNNWIEREYQTNCRITYTSLHAKQIGYVTLVTSSDNLYPNFCRINYKPKKKKDMFSTHLRQESCSSKLFYWLSKAGVAAVIDPKGMSIPTLKLLSRTIWKLLILKHTYMPISYQDQEIGCFDRTEMYLSAEGGRN
jgi:hypothetical protein